MANPSTFRPYTPDELVNAATAFGLDPAFVEAVYAVESSRGRDPNAMTARPVKRKRDSTIVRGPFQLEDDTTNDLIRRHKLGSVNVDDPDTHLELAMRLMSDLKDQYGGDYSKMAQAYLGGPGGVKNKNAKDELGTSTGAYSNKILAEMESIRNSNAIDVPVSSRTMDDAPLNLPETNTYSPFSHGADAGGDIFGMSNDMLALPAPKAGGWLDMMAANSAGSPGLGIPEELGGDLPDLPSAGSIDTDQYLARLVNEEMDNRDYNVA